MIEYVVSLLQGGAFDEWNEQIPAVAVVLLIIDLFRRILGRAKFRFDLTKIAQTWIRHKEERAKLNGDSSSTSGVKTNPHPRLNVLLAELVEEFHEFRKETDEGFRDLRNDFADGQRKLKREIRQELDQEVKLLRAKISELN